MKMDHVMEVVHKTVNLIRARGLNHRQFDILLNDAGVSHGLPYHNEIRWQSRDIALKSFSNLDGEL